MFPVIIEVLIARRAKGIALREDEGEGEGRRGCEGDEILYLHYSTAIRNPQVVSLCNGMRILFDSILDPFYQGMQKPLHLNIFYDYCFYF